METQITLDIKGNRPLLLHNSRLANPLDPYARELKNLNGKRKKTDDDLLRIAEVETRGSLYETEDEHVGLPADNVWRCLLDASRKFRLGTVLQSALLPSSDVMPLLIDGRKVKVGDFFKADDRVLYKIVVVQRNRIMRARPIVKGDWSVTARFTLLEDIMQPNMLEPIIATAGRLIGLGDWRPKYGTFDAQMTV